ncbi:MAG: hypothetical protein DRN15_10715 [Thermoprotei archaeon]|nr:MAG: hypothetical protein DRN15_10715 [Thermoprotei archaeon]
MKIYNILLAEYNPRELFNEEYFKGGRSNYNDYLRDHRFPLVARALTEIFGLEGRLVLDAGCAVPYLVDELRKLGVHAVGFDISDYARRKAVLERLEDFLQADACKTPFRDRSFYMVIASELVEHIPDFLEDTILRELTRLADKYLLIRTPYCHDPEDNDVTHVNIHPWMYWVSRVEEMGFIHDDELYARFAVRGHREFRYFFDEFMVFVRT